MEQLPERFAQLSDARIRKTDGDLAGRFGDLRIGDAKQFRGVLFDATDLHLPDQGGGMVQFYLRLDGIVEFFLARSPQRISPSISKHPLLLR